MTLDDLLPRMQRHASGRYARLYQRGSPTRIRLRLMDPGRRYVPRRLVVDIADEATVATAEASPMIPDIGVTSRVIRVSLHPGANAEISAGTTAIRGQLRRADGTRLPWARVRANQTGTGVPFGFTHVDGRGEFLLVLSAPSDSVGMTADPVSVELVVGRPLTTVAPADDPLVPTYDPLVAPGIRLAGGTDDELPNSTDLPV